MTRAQWLTEEEERLIRVRDEIDSILGVHAAHCPKCGPERYEPPCTEAANLLDAKGYLGTAVVLNQTRQDDEQPMPVYRPVVAG